jgi:hypothetical protein
MELKIHQNLKKWRSDMKRLLILSLCSAIIFTWVSVVAGVNPAVSTPQMVPVSTPMTLFLLGACLSAVSFWGKRSI